MECKSQKNGLGAFSCSEVEWGKKRTKSAEAVVVRMRGLGQLTLSEDQIGAKRSFKNLCQEIKKYANLPARLSSC